MATKNMRLWHLGINNFLMRNSLSDNNDRD